MENSLNMTNGRELRLDRMKGALCLLMLLAHAVYSFGYEDTESTVWKLISHAVNLTAFPGFLFCFGFVCERAYLAKDDRAAAAPRLWRRAGIVLLTYYVTALAAGLLGEKGLNLNGFVGIMHLSTVTGLSFLLSFTMLFVLLWLLYRPVRSLLKSGWLTALGVAVSLGFAALPALGLELPIVGILIKTNEYAGFPVLPYAGFFLLGAFLSAKRRAWDWRIGLFALLGFAAFAGFTAFTHALPKRFPPALCWVLGGYLPVYALYMLCGCMKGRIFTAVLAPLGRNTLYYLAASNILLLLYEFFSRRAGFIMPPLLYLPAYIVLVLLCIGVLALWRRIRKDNKK